MKLSAKTRYGIRMLVELARFENNNQTIPLTAIAEEMGVSLPYLRQIALHLEKAGMIKAERGINGGFKFLISPNKINLKDVFIALEGDEFIPCIKDLSFCAKTDNCEMHFVWEDIYNSFIEKLESFTIKDIAEKESRRLKTKQNSLLLKGDKHASH